MIPSISNLDTPMSLTEREKQWFTQILGFEGQVVEDVRLDAPSRQLHLFLAAAPGPYLCPLCAKEHHSLHDLRDKVVRDKPWADQEVLVHLPVLRIRCCRGRTPLELALPEL